jgi:SNF2 family DNA or RNA helicase
MDYIHQVKPWAHQRAAFELSRDLDEYALYMEQRTGKSKVLIDTSAHQYSKGKIDGLLLIAPNGVDEDWANIYFPEHWPQWAGAPIIAQWNGKLLKKDEAALYEPARATAFHVLCMNIEAFSSSPKARAAAERFLRQFRCMMAIDEASMIKDPSSNRTKHLTKLGKLAVSRRILTGTPATQSPLDVFAQFKFLNVHLLGFMSQYSFKARYADLLPENHGLVKHIKEKMPLALQRKGIVPQVIAQDANGKKLYKNLDELQKLMDPHCFRITRAECGDMPPKVYATRSVPLTDEQQHYYDRVLDEISIEMEHGTLTVQNQLSRLLRLQQITGGFMPVDAVQDGSLTVNTANRTAALANDRPQAMLSEIEQLRGKVIVWARFRAELEMIATILRLEYGVVSVAEYHGGVGSEDRAHARVMFQDDNRVRFFVAQQASGGYGLKLTAADNVIYYSNDFSLEHRLQSEDRPIALDKPQGVAYLDLQAPGTVDEKIVAALRGKKEIADALLDSGGLTAWIGRKK